MKYLTWQLDWSSEEGIDPTNSTNTDEVRIEPMFSDNDLTNPTALIYAYWIKGNIDFQSLSQWNVKEITADEFLEKAKMLVHQDAFLLEDGFLSYPLN